MCHQLMRPISADSCTKPAMLHHVVDVQPLVSVHNAAYASNIEPKTIDECVNIEPLRKGLKSE